MFEIQFKKTILHYKTHYDICMAILAVSIVISYILEVRSNLTEAEISFLKKLNFAVWVIFIIDYFTRLAYADNKIDFIKTNIIDLISILPFDYALQGLRAVRLIRIIYMLRVFIYLNRLYKRLSIIITTNDFHHVLWFTFTTIFGGAIAVSYIEDMDIGDALWWSFVTTTTVGYGDIAPSSLWGRIIAVFLMVVGIGFISTLTGTIATYFISGKHNDSYANNAIKQIINKIENFDDLTVQDINNIHAVLMALKRNSKD